jgi:hypothetical protein
VTATTTRALEYPFCVEVSLEVLEQILSLLEVMQSSSTALKSTGDEDADTLKSSSSADDERLLSLLGILDSQFYFFSHSEVDLSEIGVTYSRRSSSSAKNKHDAEAGSIVFDAGRSATLVSRLSSVLADLRLTGSGPVRSAAAKTFARGAAVFLPNIDDKIKLALSLVNKAIDEGKLDSASLLLLEMILQRLGRCDEVLKMIDMYKRSHRHRNTILDLLSKLLSMVTEHAPAYYSNADITIDA